MTAILWDREGILFVGYLPKSIAANGLYYAILLSQAHEARSAVSSWQRIHSGLRDALKTIEFTKLIIHTFPVTFS